MSFKLLESAHTGIEHLDAEHQNLISGINAIARSERSANTARAIDALSQFKMDLIAHFQNEEAELERVNYPEFSNHARHHADIIDALDRLACEIEDGKSGKEAVSSYCYHELMSTVLRRDMEFINWLADRPELKK